VLRNHTVGQNGQRFKNCVEGRAQIVSPLLKPLFVAVEVDEQTENL
jgi:hypothetical protein